MNATRAKTNETAAKDAAEAGAEALAADIADLKADLARIMERIDPNDHGALVRIRDMAEDLQGEVRRLESEIVQATRDSPWRSLGVAALVGMVFGLLIRR